MPGPGPGPIADALADPLLERAVSWLSERATPRVVLLVLTAITAALSLLR